MMKIIVDYPRQEDERLILTQFLDKEPVTLNAVATTEEILAVCPAVEAVEINEKLRDYILRLVHSTREPTRYDLKELAALLEFGASPRAVIFLARAAQAFAFLNGRDYATPDDVKEIAQYFSPSFSESQNIDYDNSLQFKILSKIKKNSFIILKKK